MPEFGYVVEFLQSMDAVDKKDLSWPKDGPKRLVTRDGIVVETRSAEDYKRVAEKAPDAIVGCEVGRWHWMTFQRVSGRLAERRGWAWLSGSFEGSLGWQAEKWNQWQGVNVEQARSFSVKTSSNTSIFPGGEDDPEIERLRLSHPLDYFRERYEGVPVPPSGRVYREFEYVSHVSEKAEYKAGKPVEVWIDPGYSGAYAVLAVQCEGDLVDIVDEVYVQRLTNEEVVQLCTRRTWWKDVAPYGVIDIAGRGHHEERSPIEAWQEVAHIHLQSEFVHISDGIDRVHSFLRVDPIKGRPGVLVNPRCLGLIAEMGVGKHPIEGMGMYRYKADSSGNVLSEVPVDKDNHACSALAYGLVNRFGTIKRSTGVSANYRQGGEYRGLANWRRRGEKERLWVPTFHYSDDDEKRNPS